LTQKRFRRDQNILEQAQETFKQGLHEWIEQKKREAIFKIATAIIGELCFPFLFQTSYA
jgi:hypothetical protein